MLAVTNISGRPIHVRMGFRDADSFTTILATQQTTLAAGQGIRLPYIEQDNLTRHVIGVVFPTSSLAGGGSAWFDASTGGSAFGASDVFAPGGQATLTGTFSIQDGTSNTGRLALPLASATIEDR